MTLTGMRIQKTENAPYEECTCCHLLTGKGISEDHHAGGGKKELSLLHADVPEQMMNMEYKGLCMRRFSANLLVEGLPSHLNLGDRLSVGAAVIEITMKKHCFDECALVQDQTPCPLKGGSLFARVVKSGEVCIGDGLILLS